MTTQPTGTTCPTCRSPRPPDEFYATSTECRSCKRQRSQQNRANAAVKIAIAERLIAALERLADQGWQPETALIKAETKTGPAGASTPVIRTLDRPQEATR